MFCLQCGTQLPDSAKFCSGCGKNVVMPANSVSNNTVAKVEEYLPGGIWADIPYAKYAVYMFAAVLIGSFISVFFIGNTDASSKKFLATYGTSVGRLINDATSMIPITVAIVIVKYRKDLIGKGVLMSLFACILLGFIRYLLGNAMDGISLTISGSIDSGIFGLLLATMIGILFGLRSDLARFAVTGFLAGFLFTLIISPFYSEIVKSAELTGKLMGKTSEQIRDSILNYSHLRRFVFRLCFALSLPFIYRLVEKFILKPSRET